MGVTAARSAPRWTDVMIIVDVVGCRVVGSAGIGAAVARVADAAA
jgi:hypothetical protein